MNEVSMSTSDIIEHMKKGAKLHRGFADKIELRLPGGVVFIPQAIFDIRVHLGWYARRRLELQNWRNAPT